MKKVLFFSLLLLCLLLIGCDNTVTNEDSPITIPVTLEYIENMKPSEYYIEPVDNSTKELFDTSWEIEKATILLGDEQIEVEVENWGNYDNSIVKIKSKDGNIYITDIKNVLLIGK